VNTQKVEKLSPARLSVPLLEGLELVNRGKVRDTYRIPPRPGIPDRLLLVVVTDGISVFDFVLNVLILIKGYVLAAMTHYWMLFLESKGIKTHFVAAGKNIDHYLPEHLRGNIDLQRRAMVVMELDMILIEFIMRFCLTGSVLSEYREKGTVYGKPMPAGLKDGDLLEEMIFTPTTKAQDGDHDKPIPEQWVRDNYREAVAIFEAACSFTTPNALEKNLLIADKKGELGRDQKGIIRVGDEWATCDSSRMWDLLIHQKMRGKANRKPPPSLDKQYMRAYAEEHGINGKLDPKNPENVAKAHALAIPQEVVDETSHLYRYAAYRLFGESVDEYGRNRMGINIPYKKKKVAFVFGSRSDIPQMRQHIKSTLGPELSRRLEKPDVHVLSCHRHDRELRAFINGGCGGADAVIATAGMAAALPGMMTTYIKKRGIKIPVIGVGVDGPTPEDHDAARLSIKRLPSGPVVINEVQGEPYMGPDGFHAAIMRVAYGELPPSAKPSGKPAELYIDIDSL